MKRLALVGPGRLGRIIVKSVQVISKSVKFTLSVSPSTAKAAGWCAAQGIALSDDLQTVLSDPQIDGVVLATPHSQHKDQIIQVAQAGKDLFCEKPIALTLADAKTALQKVKNEGIVFAAGHNRRFLPAVERMKTMIMSGDLGTILHIEGNMSSHVGFGEIYTSDMWRVAPGESPAGGLAAAGIHVIDTMIHLLGPVTSVVAQSDRLVHQIDHDDITSMLLQFDSRATGYVTTMTATAPIFRMQVFGDRGWLELRGTNDLIWKSVEGKHQEWSFPNISTERKQLEAFAEAIQSRGAFPISIEDIINGIAVFEGVLASLRLDQRITLH